jgi:hypothetical protein
VSAPECPLPPEGVNIEFVTTAGGVHKGRIGYLEFYEAGDHHRRTPVYYSLLAFRPAGVFLPEQVISWIDTDHHVHSSNIGKYNQHYDPMAKL